jgi:hypothetical protein
MTSRTHNHLAGIKLLTGFVLFIHALSLLRSGEPWWFMQNVNLVFHEAGHLFFMFGGELLYLLGGTIFEIAIPVICILAFARQRAHLSAAFASWWLVTALISVSRYVSDAQERSIQLITNDPTTHDWWQILSQLDLLSYDDTLGGIVWVAALLCSVLILFFISRDRDVLNSHLFHRHRLR